MARPVVVITGASRGIGKQMAIDFAANGYDVACLARSTRGAETKLPGTVDETAQAVEQAGGRALPLSVDVRLEEQVQRAAERVHEEFGRCDVLINNAAVAVPGCTLELPSKSWRLGVDININGPYYMMMAFCPRMLADAGVRAHQLHGHQARAGSNDRRVCLRAAWQDRCQLHPTRADGLERRLRVHARRDQQGRLRAPRRHVGRGALDSPPAAGLHRP